MSEKGHYPKNVIWVLSYLKGIWNLDTVDSIKSLWRHFFLCIFLPSCCSALDKSLFSTGMALLHG